MFTQRAVFGHPNDTGWYNNRHYDKKPILSLKKSQIKTRFMSWFTWKQLISVKTAGETRHAKEAVRFGACGSNICEQINGDFKLNRNRQFKRRITVEAFVDRKLGWWWYHNIKYVLHFIFVFVFEYEFEFEFEFEYEFENEYEFELFFVFCFFEYSRLRRVLRYNGIEKLYSMRWLRSCLDFGEYVLSLRFFINPSLINEKLTKRKTPCFDSLNYLELDLPANDTLEWYNFLHGLNPSESVEGSTKLTQYFKTRLFEFFAFEYPLYKLKQQKKKINKLLKVDDHSEFKNDDEDIDNKQDDDDDDMNEYANFIQQQQHDDEIALYDNDIKTIVLDTPLLLHLHRNVFLKRFEKNEIISIVKRYYPLMYLSLYTNLTLNLN